MKRYSYVNGRAIIELKVENLMQLFDERDPMPFRKKDLDEDAVEYILACAQEVNIDKIAFIKILTEEKKSSLDVEIVRKSVKDYFQYRSSILEKKIKYNLMIGFKSLIIGISFLSFAILCSFYINKIFDKSLITVYAKEISILLGWVSMWKPVNIFLYEWWPILEKKNIFEKLSKLEIKIKLS